MTTLEQRIEKHKADARELQNQIGDKTVKVINEYKFGEKSSCDHCGRYIVNQCAVLVDSKKQWWGIICASKAQGIELFLNV